MPLKTEVVDAFNVINKFITPEEEKQREEDPYAWKENPIPLFSVDLILQEGNLMPEYNMHPMDIVYTVMKIFDKGIETLQEIT